MALNASLEALTAQERVRLAQKRYREKHREVLKARARKKAWEYRRGIGDPDKIAIWKIAQAKKENRARERRKQHYLANKEFYAEKGRKRFQEIKRDPIRLRAYYDKNKISAKKWREKNPEYFRQQIKKWQKSNAGRLSTNASKVRQRKNNVLTLLRSRLRGRIGMALKKDYKTCYKKACSTVELLGCSVPELKAHLESLFLPGMTWENRSEWHIDHIRPCSSFNLIEPEQQKCCFHYTNLQPLWARDNILKSDKTQWA